MTLVWYVSEATTRPKEVDFDLSPAAVFLRRNIKETTKTIGDDQYTAFEYEEAKLSRADYAIYAAEQAQANVEYVACMADIDLDV